MRAAIVATFLPLMMALLCSSAFADDYAAAAARCAKESPGNFAAQMTCIQRERTEPSRDEAPAQSEPRREIRMRAIDPASPIAATIQ